MSPAGRSLPDDAGRQEVRTLDAVAVATAFSDLAALGRSRYTRADAAQRLADVAVELLGVWAAGVLLDVPDGEPEVLAASTHEARLMELVQVRSGEGPCLAALRRDEVVVVDDVADIAEQWPTWHAGARSLGIRRACGIPLRAADGTSFAALNVFVREGAPFAPGDVAVLTALADATAAGLLQEQAVADASTLATQLQAALDSRVVVEQAKGRLAALRGITVEEAFDLLRRRARSSARPLSDVARAVLEGGESDLGA